MQCGNGSERSQHPSKLFDPDWAEWEPPVADGQAPRDADDKDGDGAG